MEGEREREREREGQAVAERVEVVYIINNNPTHSIS